MLHAIWQDGLVVFGHRGRTLALSAVDSLAAALFVSGESFDPVTVALQPPGRRGGPITAEALRIPVAAAAEGFAVREWVPWRSLSPSLGWFASAAALARGLAAAGYVVPSLRAGRVGWLPVVTPAIGAELARLTTAMPPVVTVLADSAEPWRITQSVVASFTDDAARVRLADVAVPSVGGTSRRPTEVVARRVAAALAAEDPHVVVNGPAEEAALDRWAAEMERWIRPVDGRSPLAGVDISLRVVEPQDLDTEAPGSGLTGLLPEELPWLVEVLLAPHDDPSLLVPAADLGDPSAADLLGRDIVDAAVTAHAAGRRIAALAPSLHQLGGTEPTGIAELDLDDLVAFLRSEAAQLEQAGISVLLPSWWRRTAGARVLGRARAGGPAAVTPAGLDVAAIASVDWRLALDGEPLTDDERRRLALAKHELVHLRGKWVRFDAGEVRHALAVFASRAERTAQPIGALALLALQADPEIDLDGERDDDWITDLLAGLPDDRLEPLTEPPGFHGTLRPYQRRGLGWLAFLDRLGLGGCLADDMGLGKTAQLLALLAHERSAPRGERVGPTLVVCPLSVVHNWETEAARFTPSLRVHVAHGPDRARGDELVALAAEADLIVTTYAVATRDAADLARIPWQRLVADEAQQVKNAHTHAARALKRLPARQKLALTGTPVENRLSELWSVMDLVNPGLLGSQRSFRDRFAVPIERYRQADATAALRTLVQPFLLRRSKADRSLVPDLPPKLEQVAWCALTREQATLYQSAVDVLLATLESMRAGPDDGRGSSIDRRGAILAALTRLKQICNHPAQFLRDASRLDGRSGKLARFDELFTDILDSGERLIVFTQFREMGELLVRHLHDRSGLAVPFLHGGVTKARRDRMVETFQQGEGGPVLLVSLKAGGSGLNLTAASRVIHYDRWWNPAVEDQASDRAWRIGQERTVLVHQLVCQGTVEERIDTVIREKRALADHVLGTGEAWVTELTTDELRDLVSLRGTS